METLLRVMVMDDGTLMLCRKDYNGVASAFVRFVAPSTQAQRQIDIWTRELSNELLGGLVKQEQWVFAERRNNSWLTWSRLWSRWRLRFATNRS